ncbi:COG4648 family protein [Bowmanella yangjiangensis]|uniref:COG4648 family protein n=1 Tax=Bowmanella yangjiangensis TaxID=2811230 RepID=UPI002FCD8009
MNWVLTLLLFLYPFILYAGMQFSSAIWVALCLLPLAIWRLWGLRRHIKGGWLWTGICVLSLLFGQSILSDSDLGMRLYPVLVNLALLVWFTSSLYFPPPVVERLARLKEPDLPAHAITYTRKVTKLWCIFFLLNGSVALYTSLFSSLSVWTFYNGFLAYCLMGMLGAGEYLVRRKVKQAHGQ